jgi:2-keto-4-pentenoate hydratase
LWPLCRSGITPEQVLAATEACALGAEIIASRIANWRIKLADTIKDNASCGGSRWVCGTGNCSTVILRSQNGNDEAL